MTEPDLAAEPVADATREGPSGGDLGHGIVIGLAAFFSGMAIMVIELTGTRLLAPWFGNSLYTWTGLIGVVLISISCGYYLGGLLADWKPEPVVLAHLLSASALLTCSIPLLYPRFEATFSSWDIVRGPVMVTALLFALPGCCVAAVAPFSVRLMSLRTGDRKIGLSSGYVGMFGTLGSVVGTFATGFVLVPNLELRTIFLITGAILGVLALVGYGVHMRPSGRGALLGFVPLALWALPGAGIVLVTEPSVPGLLFEKYSYYHRIRVMEKETGRGLEHSLYLDSTLEGAQIVDSDEVPIVYQKYWRLAEAFCPDLESAAFLGGGAFAMPEALSRRFPLAEVDVAEIDPAVIVVGRRFFRLDEHPRVNAVSQDARRFLRMGGKNYDFIFGDAYNGVRYIPAHLVTVEFFEIVKAHLNDDGIYVMNILSPIAGDHADIFETISNSVSDVFPHVYVFQARPNLHRPRLFDSAPDLSRSHNAILLASNRAIDMAATLERHSQEPELAALLATHVPKERIVGTRDDVLTDEANPIDYLVSRSLE